MPRGWSCVRVRGLRVSAAFPPGALPTSPGEAAGTVIWHFGRGKISALKYVQRIVRNRAPLTERAVSDWRREMTQLQPCLVFLSCVSKGKQKLETCVKVKALRATQPLQPNQEGAGVTAGWVKAGRASSSESQKGRGKGA